MSNEKSCSNKNDIGYAAWILTPEFRTADGMDLAWLGAWPDGEAYGVSMERWKSPGNELLPLFNEVMECGTHVMLGSLPINAPFKLPERDPLSRNVHMGWVADVAEYWRLNPGDDMAF